MFDATEVEAFYDWRNDLFFRRFDMTGKDSVDYMTARRTYKGVSGRLLLGIWHSQPKVTSPIWYTPK
ncbi:MAG: hypothetical protein OET79_04055 [Nitrospirota bacterium]|nr:hypothetical protein [Nitrospirota bacterium]